MSDESNTPFATNEIPLYYQLGTILREQILSGRYAPGEKLPTEADLVNGYGVSRITVRQALKSLEEEGMIRREAGRGTFVNADVAPPEMLQMDGSLDDLISMGLATSVKLVDLRHVSATRKDRETFGLREGAQVVQCTRVRYYQDKPYSYIVNRLPAHLADRFEDHNWESGSILQFFEEKLGLDLKEAEQTVRATLADALLAKALDVRVGAPLLSVDRVVLTRSGSAVERVHTYYRGDIYSLTVHLTRDQGQSRPAQDWTLKNRSEGGA
ncbi:MAG: GntR family transcriptional regulator [Acidobacteriota bacterium]